jgi:hypothetical protein
MFPTIILTADELKTLKEGKTLSSIKSKGTAAQPIGQMFNVLVGKELSGDKCSITAERQLKLVDPIS